jgi:hypothetical protein
MKTVKMTKNVHLSPNFGLARAKYKEGAAYDAPKGSVQEVQDDVAAVLSQRKLAEIITADIPEPKETKGTK